MRRLPVDGMNLEHRVVVNQVGNTAVALSKSWGLARCRRKFGQVRVLVRS